MSDEEEEENKDSSGEQEEENEEEEEEKGENNKKIQSNKNEIKTRSYYLSIITKLKSEIETTKKLNSNTQKTVLEEEYEKLQQDLNQKKSLLEKLIKTNNKQKAAFDSLSNRLNKETTKINRLIEKEENEENNDNVNKRKSVKLEEDKQLNKATKTMKELRIENSSLIKKLFENKDYTDNINLGNLNKEIKEQLDKKTDEKNSLMKQLKSHIVCIEDQKKLKEEINTLTKNLKATKNSIQEIKDKIDDLLLQNNMPFYSFDKARTLNIKNRINKINNTHTSKRIIKINISTPNIHSNKNSLNILKNNKINLPLILNRKSPKTDWLLNEDFFKKLKEHFNNNDKEYNDLIEKIKLFETKRKKTENRNKNELTQNILKNNKINLPLILNRKSPKTDWLLNEDFFKKLKEYFNNNDKEYNDLIEKINLFETKRKKTENRNKNELTQNILKLHSLDEKFRALNIDKKFSIRNSHLLKNKLNVFILEKHKKVKQLQELRKELQNKINISKTKDNEITDLMKQIKSIKDLVSLCQIKVEDNNIKKYIELIQKEQRTKKAFNTSKEESKNENKISVIKSKNEESIQTDNSYTKIKKIKKKKKK